MADDIRAERLLNLQLRFMDNARLTVARMESDYGTDRRTVNRDLNTLMDCGLKLENVRGPDNRKIWSLSPRSRRIPVPFNLTDLTALFMGRRLFDFLRGTLLEESLDKIYETIETRLDRQKDLVKSQDLARKVHLVSEGPKKLSAKHVAVLDDVLTGLLDERLLEVTYVNAANQKNTYCLEPYTLVAFRRGLYLLARIHKSDAILTFALERIHKAKILRGTNFDFPKDFSPAKYFDKALFIQTGKPQKVELSFSLGSEKYIRIRKFHKRQKMKTLPDGRLHLTMRVPINDEILYWVLSFGSNVVVESPPELQQMVKKQLRKAARQYK
jgi:predicted DNA-binding transcriptional regulator YafY